LLSSTCYMTLREIKKKCCGLSDCTHFWCRRSVCIEASVVNQELNLGQTTLVISPRALKVSFSLSLLGLSTSCSTQKLSRNFSKSCSKDNQKVPFVRNVAQTLLGKKHIFFGLMLKYASHFRKSGSVGGVGGAIKKEERSYALAAGSC